MKSILVTALLIAASAAQAGPVFFDMGTADSDLWEGFARVTDGSAFSAETGFGWQTGEGLKASARAYKELVENKSRGREEPPPIWTNAITEDVIGGDRENAFLMKLAPGDYEIFVVCGSSDARREQFHDFTVQVGGGAERVQIEGPFQFRALRFQARAGAEPIEVRFLPVNRWIVNAILAWPAADGARVEREVIAPFAEWTWRLPPAEWAKWTQEPEPEPGPAPPVSDADRARGFVVFSRHYLECIYPRTQPRPEEMNPELRAFASPGEYEPLTFTVHPLRNLAGAKVTVSGLGPVKASDIDVRHVRFLRARPNYTVTGRYRIVPDTLERFDSLDLPAGENARFWLTVRVPDDAPPGLYRGGVTFTCAAGSATLPVSFRILPIRLLEDPAKIFGIYYRHPYDLMRGAPDGISREYFRRKAELQHADMAAHGTRNVVLSAYSPPADYQGAFRFDWDTLAAKIELWRRHRFTGPIVMGFNTEGVYEKYMKERPGSHLRNVKDPPPEFSRELTEMVSVIESERRARGWPEFLYYPIDEPGPSPEAVRFMVTVLQACRAAGVRTYVTADPTREQFEPMRPFVDVWCTQPFAPDRDTVLADMQGRRVEYWCYPNHVNGENDHTPVAGARMTYGFGFWRSGFVTLIPWIYSYDVGDPYNYLDGSTMDFFNRHEPDGTPVPVAMWEAYREGYDDYRYLYTLAHLIAETKPGEDAAAREAVDAAKRELGFVWDNIRVQPKYKDTGLWAPAEFDAHRWIIARQILALQELTGENHPPE